MVSYGGLPYGLSKEGFFQGVSKPVNKALLTLFILSNYAEQSGHGIPTIVSVCGKDAFSFDDNLLRVTLKFAFEPDYVAERKAMEHMQTKLTENQKKIYAFLIENPTTTLQNVADEIGLSLGGVKKNVAKLQEIGMLRRTGGKKKGLWEKRNQ